MLPYYVYFIHRVSIKLSSCRLRCYSTNFVTPYSEVIQHRILTTVTSGNWENRTKVWSLQQNVPKQILTQRPNIMFLLMSNMQGLYVYIVKHKHCYKKNFNKASDKNVIFFTIPMIMYICFTWHRCIHLLL